MREYGELAEAECEARASYCEMQGEPVAAEAWRNLKAEIRGLKRR